MRYFDSPKNKAFWEKEMAVLRKQRADREAGRDFQQEKAFREEGKESNPRRIRVTYEELLKMEADSMGMEREQKRKHLIREKEKERTAKKGMELQ